MTGEAFIKVVNYFGEDNILGFGFDNSAAVTFDKDEFKLTNNYIPEIESFCTVGIDSRGHKFRIIKHVDSIQTVIVRDESVPFNAYDRVSLRP